MASDSAWRPSAVWATGAGWNARLGQSYLGRSLQLGAAESFGVYFSGSAFGTSGVVNEGFLGIKGTLSQMAADRPVTHRQRFDPSRVYKGSRAMGAGVGRSSWNVARHTAKRTGARGVARFAGATAMKSLGVAGTALFAYQGYKENGALGAAMGVGESILYTAAFRAIGGAVFNPATIVAAGGVLAGIGIYEAGEAAKNYVKGLGNLEFGGEHMMGALGSAGAATSRQRSMMALQNTHLNGRMALGNEALLSHTSFR